MSKTIKEFNDLVKNIGGCDKVLFIHQDMENRTSNLLIYKGL